MRYFLLILLAFLFPVLSVQKRKRAGEYTYSHLGFEGGENLRGWLIRNLREGPGYGLYSWMAF